MIDRQKSQHAFWLVSPIQKKVLEDYQFLSEELQQNGILFNSGPLAEDCVAALVICDENCSEEELIKCVQNLLAQNLKVIVLSLKKRAMPFYKVWELLGAGVDDVINFKKPESVGKLLKAKFKRWSIIERYLQSDRVKNVLVGSSPVWLKTLREVIEIACFSTTPLLILGESGTGKELVTRLIHDLDKRIDKQELILLDCSTIVPELSGSEFFGHEKGAFTNAVVTRDGAFALADKGTLFLDEVGELPLRLQAELLRVIQEGSFKRVGSNIWKSTQFRLICATNRILSEEVQQGRFREDLYYRLSSCVVRLPPLRERRLDIPELARHFLCMALNTDHPPSFDKLVMRFILTKNYPGNIRQLKHLIHGIAYRHTGDVPITIGNIPETDREDYVISEDGWQENGFKDGIRHAISNGIGLKEIKRITGNVALKIAIEDASGNLQQAARQLNVSDRLVQGYLSNNKH